MHTRTHTHICYAVQKIFPRDALTQRRKRKHFGFFKYFPAFYEMIKRMNLCRLISSCVYVICYDRLK